MLEEKKKISMKTIMRVFTLLTICVVCIHAQQQNVPPGQTQNFQNRGTNFNGINTFTGQGVRPVNNFNLQGTQRQGMVNTFGASRGFSSPFRPLVPGRVPFGARGFGGPFFRPGMGATGRGFREYFSTDRIIN